MTKPISESVAKALVVNENNEALILTLGEHKERPEKSFRPDLPGGLVDPGETEVTAVAREVQEETGIVVDADAANLVYARTEFFEQENKSVTKFLYVINIHSMPKVQLSWEHSAYEWVPLKGIMDSIDLRSFYKEAIEYCFANELL